MLWGCYGGAMRCYGVLWDTMRVISRTESLVETLIWRWANGKGR